MRLMIANVAMFLISLAAPEVVSALMFVPVLALSRPWTILTYMFLHGGFWHLFFNMLGLYFFGPRLEEEIGSKHFLYLYAVSGLMGAAFSFVSPFTAIVGASGAVYGVLLGFAFFWPREPIYLWGILPVEARWMVVGMTALSLWGGFDGSDNIAHFAHLGGFVGGYLYVKWYSLRGRRIRIPEAIVLPGPRNADIERWGKIDSSAMHPVNREEYQRIRAKMATQGTGRLTQEERTFLDRFSPE
jgi:membrane associated rhomboid family serine protease